MLNRDIGFWVLHGPGWLLLLYLVYAQAMLWIFFTKRSVRIPIVDTFTDGHLWAERYDRDLNDIFALQDEVTQKIVGALAVTLTEDEQERLVHKYTDSIEAYDYYLRGWEYL